MSTKNIDQERSIGTTLAFPCGVQRSIQPAQAMEQDHVLRERDHKHGWSNGFPLDVPRQALSIPALIQLTQPVDDVPVKAQSFCKTLRHLAMTDEHGWDARKPLHSAFDGVINRLGGFARK